MNSTRTWRIHPANRRCAKETSLHTGSTCSSANRCAGHCGNNRYSLENATRSVESGAMVYRQSLAIAIVVTALSLPAYADRGNDAYKQGVRAERQADYDAATAYYKQAYAF